MGHDVTVLEQRAQPGRPRVPAARRRLHLGHRPVARDDALGARGDVRRRRARLRTRGDARAARSVLPDLLGGRGRAHGLRRGAGADARARSRSSPPRDALAFDGFMAALQPDLRAGHPRRGAGASSRRCASLRALHADDGCGSGAAQPLSWLVARHFRHPRVREAFSFHSLFIGGDPFRVPAIYARARLPPVRRGRLVRAGRRLLDRRGDGAGARRALRRRGSSASRRAGGARDGRRARGRRASSPPTSSSRTATCCARPSCSAGAPRCGG